MGTRSSLQYDLGQGIGYSGDSPAKVLTKFCTQNGSPNKFWPCIRKLLASQAFQPCMTLWVQNCPKLPKKIIFSQKSPFPHTWLCQSFADIWPLTTLLLWLSIDFSCMLLSFKISHHEAFWGWKCRNYEIFCKKFPWTIKNWKNSFFSYKCNFRINCHSKYF